MYAYRCPIVIFLDNIAYQGIIAWDGLNNAMKCSNNVRSLKHPYKARKYALYSYCTFSLFTTIIL